MRYRLIIILFVVLSFLYISCSRNEGKELEGTYHRVIDNSEISLSLYPDSIFMQSLTRDVSDSGINGYPDKATLQLNGKWYLSNDSLALISLHMSDLGSSMEMNDTIFYKIVHFDGNKLVIKSLSNNDVQEYLREKNL